MFGAGCPTRCFTSATEISRIASSCPTTDFRISSKTSLGRKGKSCMNARDCNDRGMKEKGEMQKVKVLRCLKLLLLPFTFYLLPFSLTWLRHERKHDRDDEHQDDRERDPHRLNRRAMHGHGLAALAEEV